MTHSIIFNCLLDLLTDTCSCDRILKLTFKSIIDLKYIIFSLIKFIYIIDIIRTYDTITYNIS